MKNGLGNKQVMARNIQRLMEQNGKTRMDLCNDLGLKYTTVTDWLKGNTYPRIDAIEKMARYFGVNKVDLVEEPAVSTDYYIDAEARELAEFLRKNPDYKILFDAARSVSQEDIAFVKDMIDRMRR